MICPILLFRIGTRGNCAESRFASRILSADCFSSTLICFTHTSRRGRCLCKKADAVFALFARFAPLRREPNKHQERPSDDKQKPERRLFPQPLMKYNSRKRNRDENAKLIYRYDDARKPVPKRLVIAEPRAAGGYSRETDKAELAARNAAHRMLLALNKHNKPRHGKHDSGAYGGAEIRLNTIYSHLSEYRGQARKYG